MFKIISFLAVFFFSLSTFSYRAAALGYFFLFLSIAPFWKKTLVVKRRDIFYFLLINISVIACSLLQNIYWIYYVKFLGMMFFASTLYVMYTSNIIKISDIEFYCKALIIVNLTFFLIQLIAYQAFGHFIDFNNMVREQESTTLYASRALNGFILSIRATGLYSEPSFYSMSVFCPTMILMLLNKKINKYVLLGLFSCALSLSIASLAIVALAMIILFFRLKKNYLLKGAVIAVIVLSAPYLGDFYTKRITDDSDYDAISSRLLILKEFEARDFINDIVGSGFFWAEDEPIGKIGLKGYHTRDSSFYPYIYFSGGIFGLLLLFFFLSRLGLKNLDILYGVIITLLFKFNILSSFFWIFIVFCKALATERRKNRSNLEGEHEIT